MRTNKKFISFILAIFVLFVVVLPAYALTSSDFLSQAQQWVDRHCSRARVSNETALLCYLFAKTSETDAAIADLQQRVAALENPPTPSPSPSPQPEIDFQTNFDEEFTVPQGYNVMLIDILGGISFPWAPGPSFDNGVSFPEQHRFFPADQSVIIPVLSDKYMIRSGGSTGVQVRIRLQQDPNSQVINFGTNESYPFTSSPFDATGFNSIIVTASGGDNPQNLSAIVLQKEVGGVFVEDARSNCDGGAQCPPTSFPVTSGNYRVVIEGSGTGALFAALLRP